MTLTTAEMILLAAVDLDELRPTFTIEDLTVRAFELYPTTFALRGYPQWVDSQRVQSKVYGTTGLVGRGMLEFVVTKTLRLTAKGRAAVREDSAGGLRIRAPDRTRDRGRIARGW